MLLPNKTPGTYDHYSRGLLYFKMQTKQYTTQLKGKLKVEGYIRVFTRFYEKRSYLKKSNESMRLIEIKLEKKTEFFEMIACVVPTDYSLNQQ